MKITVCFDSVRVIVPCGNGDLSVEALTQRAIARYKKATNKHLDDIVRVQVLETIEERAILDPDDVVNDVLDDKDKVIAVFEEQLINRPAHNGGDGMSTSSVSTTSPDIFQSELIGIQNGLYSSKDENDNDTTPSKLVVVSTRVNEKLPPPPVAAKPKGYKKKDTQALPDSLPSEDSGIYITSRNRVGSDSSKSEHSEASPCVIRTAETAFVAIGTPIQTNTQGNLEIKKNGSEKEFELDDDDGTFSLGRNSARQSMFVDNPVLDRWAELQHKRTLDEQEKREDPAGASMSPTEESLIANSILGEDKIDGSDSICSGEYDGTLTISLQPEVPGDLGFKVAGYKTSDGRELGLIVREVSSTGCAAKDGKLQVADRILQINDKHLTDLSNERAEEIFGEECQLSHVQLIVSGAHSFVNENKHAENCQQEGEEVNFSERATTSEPNGIEPPPGFRDNGKGLSNKLLQVSSNAKKINRRFLIELNKGSDGLGFSITTRDNPAGGNTPIFVKGILAKGAAIEDGQLRSGDQIIEVNGTEMSGKSQGEAVNILRSTRGLVKLLIQREEIVQAPTKPSLEVNEESTRFLQDQGKQVLTFKIPLSYSGAAGLGISVKGKPDGDLPEDKGIYVKSVIAGGAAQKDGRLQADDQLLSVNNVSFLGLPNTEAIDKLRTAMQTTRLGQAFIEVTIARLKDNDVESVRDVQHSEQEERPIEAQAAVRAMDEPDNVPIEASQKSPIETSPSRPNISKNVLKKEPADIARGSQSSLEGEDEFLEATPIQLNLSPSKYRNAVQRNESYCFAVGGPHHKRPVRPSPLLDRATETFRNRPSSTVGISTPSCNTNGQSKGRNPSPIPPPRVDSFSKATMANYQIRKHMSESNASDKQGLSSSQKPSPKQGQTSLNEVNSIRRSYQRLPSYEQTLERIRSRSGGSEEGSQDGVFTDTEIIVESPFEREGFGRQSMSEKRARASVDAKKTQMYQIREKHKELNQNRTLNDNVPSSSLPLRKTKSEGHMQINALKGDKNLQPSNRQVRKSTSESTLSESDVRKASTSNHSFRNAIEGPLPSVTVSNGITRTSQGEEQEIPITMTSKADFNAVQQKLTKKPFYRKFKIGKTRRGEYNLADAEGSPKHSIYGQEALIDFPSEQRYRQLVSHYDDDMKKRPSSLTNGRNVDQTDGNQEKSVKIGRVIVSEPTRV